MRKRAKPPTKRSDEIVAKIAELLPQMAQYEVAVELGISQSAVSKWARDAGLPTRTPAETKKEKGRWNEKEKNSSLG